MYLNRHFHDAMDDFRWLATDIGSRPTRIGEVIPEAPLFTGTSDAAGKGAGGVWLPEGDLMYRAALKEDTLRPSLATDRGQAVAEAVATMAAAGQQSLGSNKGASSDTRDHSTG